jgi:hypothetical protein
VTSGQKVSAAAKALGIVEQTLANWVKADRSGRLRGLSGEQLSAERMENIRLRAELARGVGWSATSSSPQTKTCLWGPRPGKSHGVLREGAAMKYAWIGQNKGLWPVCVQCRVLGVSGSGYRRHRAQRKQILTRRHLSETALLVEIRAVYTEARGRVDGPACGGN